MEDNKIDDSKWEESFRLVAPVNIEIKKKEFICTVVHGKGTDNIFQFFEVRHKDFDNLLAEVIEDYFGATESFALDYIADIDSYALLAKNLRDNPMFNVKYHVEGFLDILAGTIREAA
jgi:hypothetical protein